MSVEEIAAAIDDMLGKMDAAAPWRDERALSLEYNPRNVGPQRADEGPRDPWVAWTSRMRGTGQTAEMALLDLKAALERDMREVIERARERMAEDAKRLDEMAALLRKDDRRSDSPRNKSE